MSAKNDERLVARIPKEQKELVEYAVSLIGGNVSDFVRSTVEKEAKKTIKEYKVLELSKRDSKAFIETLNNPPEPNEALKEAAKAHKELIGE